METIILITLFVIGGIILTSSLKIYGPKSVKINILKSEAEDTFRRVQAKIEKQIEITQNNSDKSPPSELSKKLLEAEFKHQRYINNMRSKYLKLDEKYKHDKEKRSEIIQDWYEFMKLLDRILIVDEYGAYEYTKEDYRKRDEYEIRRSEIMKRWRSLLSNGQ